MSTTPPQMPETPTLERVRRVSEKSQAIGEFLEWLQDRGYTLAVPSSRRREGHQECLEPAVVSRNALLHRFFGIDEEQESRERESLLEHMRELTEFNQSKSKQEKTR